MADEFEDLVDQYFNSSIGDNAFTTFTKGIEKLLEEKDAEIKRLKDNVHISVQTMLNDRQKEMIGYNSDHDVALVVTQLCDALNRLQTVHTQDDLPPLDKGEDRMSIWVLAVGPNGQFAKAFFDYKTWKYSCHKEFCPIGWCILPEMGEI